MWFGFPLLALAAPGDDVIAVVVDTGAGAMEVAGMERLLALNLTTLLDVLLFVFLAIIGGVAAGGSGCSDRFFEAALLLVPVADIVAVGTELRGAGGARCFGVGRPAATG